MSDNRQPPIDNHQRSTGIGVLVVEDHPLTQARLRTFLAAYPDLSLLGIVENGEGAIEFCEREEPDVILMDLIMPGMGGAAATREIKKLHPRVNIILLTNSDELDSIKEALAAGASICLLKTSTATEIATAIRAAKS